MDLDEQGSSNSTQEVTAGASKVLLNSKVLLRWNFPTMRKVYINLLDNFIQNCTLDQVISMCDKESSFCGFWYESEFFRHYSGGSSILVKYITPIQSERPTSLQLQICNIVEIIETDTQLITGSLYEMRARYPIVDAVGYLKETTSEEKWLAFIQLSISSHARHKSMHGVFKKAPRGVLNKSSKGKQSPTIFKYYRELCKETSKPMKVLLLYISPKEYFKTSTEQEEKDPILLPNLKQEIKDNRHDAAEYTISCGVFSPENGLFYSDELRSLF